MMDIKFYVWDGDHDFVEKAEIDEHDRERTAMIDAAEGYLPGVGFREQFGSYIAYYFGDWIL